MSSLAKTKMSRAYKWIQDTNPAFEGLSSPCHQDSTIVSFGLRAVHEGKNLEPTGISGGSASASFGERVKRARSIDASLQCLLYILGV